MAKKIRASTESTEARRERLSLSGAMTTKVIKDKTKYSRKVKHKSI